MNGGSDSMCRLGQFPTAGDTSSYGATQCLIVGSEKR